MEKNKTKTPDIVRKQFFFKLKIVSILKTKKIKIGINNYGKKIIIQYICEPITNMA